MNTQIFIDTRNTAKPVPLSDGVYAQHLEEMRLVALDLIELLARERARTFEGSWCELLARVRSRFGQDQKVASVG